MILSKGTAQPSTQFSMEYRTRDGHGLYAFSLERQGDGTWRVYVDRVPSFGFRDTNLIATRLMSTADGRQYLAWDEPLWESERAQQIATVWADQTQNYIHRGQRF